MVEGTRQVVVAVMAKSNFNFDSCRIWAVVHVGASIPFVLVRRLASPLPTHLTLKAELRPFLLAGNGEVNSLQNCSHCPPSTASRTFDHVLLQFPAPLSGPP